MAQGNSSGTRKRPLIMNSTDLSASPYAKMLLHIAKNLTEEEVADVKLWLSVDGLLSAHDIRKIKHASDLFRVMHAKNLIPKDGQSLEPLMQLSTNISRPDLKRHIEEYSATDFKDIDRPQCSKIRNIYRFRNGTDDDSVSVSSSSSSGESMRSFDGRSSQPPPLYLPPLPPAQQFHNKPMTSNALPLRIISAPSSRRSSEMDDIIQSGPEDTLSFFSAQGFDNMSASSSSPSIVTSAPGNSSIPSPAAGSQTSSPSTTMPSPIQPPRLVLPPANQGSGTSDHEEIININ